jgi:predicted PurR-regulated permease PerM
MGLYLLMTHQAAAGLFILGWGAVMVGVVDNLARPRICSARMAVHPLIVFVTMFGGFAVFGMMGLLVGPLVASLFMSMIRIYRRDFLPDHAHVLLGGEPVRAEPAPAKNAVRTVSPLADTLPPIPSLTKH